jgi:putative membrane protein
MINYNPRTWFTSIFRFSKADTLRKLAPLMVVAGIYSGLIAWLELEYFGLEDDSQLKNVGMMHTVLGFVISLLLVFRTNTAYDRWWEGRKVWGSLANNSRNLAIKLNAFLKDEDDRRFFRLMIPNFGFALRNHLRENEDFHELDPVLDLKPKQNLPNQLVASLFSRISHLHVNGKITGPQLSMLNEELRSFTEIGGSCDRIKNSPIPYTYSAFIKKFVFLYVMTLPFGWVFSLGYFIIPVVCLILYAMASLELIAEEIENPFGTDANDLPIDQICQNIRKHVGEILS